MIQKEAILQMTGCTKVEAKQSGNINKMTKGAWKI